MTTIASKYAIELRDKNGNLKTHLTPFVSNASWEWNRIGGCGRCSLTIKKGYRDIIFDARDDIQIRMENIDYDPYTKLLVHFDGADGATAYTAETGQTATFVNQAELDTAQKKFGATSVLFDGTGDAVTFPDSDDWALGNAFTIDCQVMVSTFPSDAGADNIIGQYEGVNDYWRFTLMNDGGDYYGSSGACLLNSCVN